MKLLDVEEDARKHPQAKEGGSCLRPTSAGTSPALANVRDRWVGQRCEELN